MFRNKQAVVIVKSDGREAQYAQLLFQMIGSIPNYELPQPLSEAEYQTSFTTIDNIPNEKVIFFGNGKEAALQAKAVKWQYDCFGMKYGWLGNRCVITADPDGISLKEQSAFAEYYNGKISEFRHMLELKHIRYSETETLDTSEMDDAIKWKDTDDTNDKIAKAGVTAIMGIPIALVKAVKGVNDTVENIRAKVERADLWKHQYELLVCEYILNGLTHFMDNTIPKNSEKKAIIVYDSKDSEYAHLLHNLIQQYSGCDVAEFTEKMFLDNAKNLSSQNKIIFLGKMKSAKERWLGINRYKYDKNGMCYGWSGNHAFIYTEPLKLSEIEAFKEEYRQKSKKYEDKAKSYMENNGCDIGRKAAVVYNVGAVAMFSLPGLVIAGINHCIGKGVDKAIDYAKTIADLSGYQYQLLLREFVFNGFEKFMEEA